MHPLDDGGHLTPVDAPDSATATLAVGVLVVESNLEHRLVSLDRLARAGFHVTVAETFALAKALVVSQPPDVLITGIRLGIHNGLHLVLRAKTAQPRLAALVTATIEDTGLRDDAEALGATFVLTPVSERDLIGAILQTVFRRDATAPIRPPFERRYGERRSVVASMLDERRNNDRRRALPWFMPTRASTETLV